MDYHKETVVEGELITLEGLRITMVGAIPVKIPFMPIQHTEATVERFGIVGLTRLDPEGMEESQAFDYGRRFIQALDELEAKDFLEGLRVGIAALDEINDLLSDVDLGPLEAGDE